MVQPGENEPPGRGARPDLEAVAVAMSRVPRELDPVLRVVDGRRRAFICLFVWGDRPSRFNATDSARRAGFAHPHVAGSRLRHGRATGRLIDLIISDRLGETGRRRASA